MVVLVPELLSGHHDKGGAADVPAARPATEGPPLRSYTMDLRAPTETAATDQTALNVRPAEGEGANLPAPVPAPEVAPEAPPKAPAPPAAAAAPARTEQPKPQPQPEPRPQAAPQAKAEKPQGAASQAQAAPVVAEPPKAAKGVEAAPVKPEAKPAVAKPAAEKAVPAGKEKGWFVQVGSFAKRENAQHLVQQLAAKGHSAQLRGGSGGGLFRVRVGPVANRQAAVALQARLAAQGFRGAVSAP